MRKFVSDLYKSFNFWRTVDRIGPDIPTTHWKLYFKSTMMSLCRAKFKHFDETSYFRPGAYAVYCSNISIGKNVVIRPDTMLFSDDPDQGPGIVIEDNVLIGSGVHIGVGNHRFDNPRTPIIEQGYTESKEVILKKGCWIGAKVIILSGVTIGENAVVGAGSVVTKSIPDRVVAVGNPAKIVRYIS
jgi:acetyltransferase-like isoleucine patch superfamily enzyme